MAEQKATVGRAKPSGSKQHVKKDWGIEYPDAPPTLIEAGIDKNLARDARALASVPETKFEAALTGGGRPCVAKITGKPKPQSGRSCESGHPEK